MSGIREKFTIPKNVVMEDSGGLCDLKGYASKVAILVSYLSHGLRLPFGRPLCDILGLALVQLHPFTLRTFLSACIAYCVALKLAKNPYPDLTAHKFLHFYIVWTTSKENMASFRKKGKGQVLL